MRFPDFYAAKREEVPSYVQAAYLQNRSDQAAAAEDRMLRQERANNIQAMGTGAMNVAGMDIGDGKTPMSELIRMGKEKWGSGAAQNPAAPSAGEISRGPPPVSSALPKAGIGGMQGGTALPRAPTPTPTGRGSAVGDAVREADPGVWQAPVTPSDTVPNVKLPSSTTPPMPGYGPGPQAAASGPTAESNAALLKAYKTNITPDMTASVGNAGARPTNAALTAMANKGPQAAAQQVAPTVAADVAGKGIEKGMGAAFAQAGGAAVPVVGGVTGAIPAALRGDTMGAVKGGVGGAASSTLMAAGPAMAAAGPVGWAGMAGLAALSLYGMLG